MRCGCTGGGGIGQQCPPCPLAEFLSYLDGSLTPLDIPLSTTPTTRNLASIPISIPAAVPGFGLWMMGSASMSLFGENTGAIVVTALKINATVLQASVVGNVATFGPMATNTTEVDAINGGQNNITPGNYALFYEITAQLIAAGTGTLRVHSATLYARLPRANNYTVFGGP